MGLFCQRTVALLTFLSAPCRAGNGQRVWLQNINRKSEDGELTSSAALLILWKTVSLVAVADFLHVHSFTIMALRFNLSSSYFLKWFLVRCPLLSNLRDLSVDLCFCPAGPSFELFLFFHPSVPSTLPPPHPLVVARHPGNSGC